MNKGFAFIALPGLTNRYTKIGMVLTRSLTAPMNLEMGSGAACGAWYNL